jgi:GDPmannose 4,6-dehydratase
MKSRRALIIGATGQDGTLLRQSLALQNVEFVGVGSQGNWVRSRPEVNLPTLELGEVSSLVAFLRDFEPTEIYYLAAHHVSSEQSQTDLLNAYQVSERVHVKYLMNVLESLRQTGIPSRLFYAASCRVFGDSTPPQNETTPFSPTDIYGVTKLAGLLMCRQYRERYGVFASVGILYQHESHLRAPVFLSRRVIQAAVSIAQGKRSELLLGDLGAVADWGYAPDYVEAMQEILGVDEPEDFIVSTGEGHTVKDFVKVAFEAVGLNWADYVKEDRSLIKKGNLPLIGSFEKLNRATGWRPSLSFVQMIERLVSKEKEAAL